LVQPSKPQPSTKLLKSIMGRKTLAKERNPLYEEIADVTIRTDDQSAKVVANQIINMLESN